MRKLTAEERAAKKAGQTPEAEVVVEPTPKKKAKKSEPAEPSGIGSDSFVFKKKETPAEEPAATDAEKVENSGEPAADTDDK